MSTNNFYPLNNEMLKRWEPSQSSQSSYNQLFLVFVIIIIIVVSICNNLNFQKFIFTITYGNLHSSLSHSNYFYSHNRESHSLGMFQFLLFESLHESSRTTWTADLRFHTVKNKTKQKNSKNNKMIKKVDSEKKFSP